MLRWVSSVSNYLGKFKHPKYSKCSIVLGQVADMVRKSGMTVTFHVIGEDAYKQAKADGVNLAEPQAQTGQNQPTMNGVSAPAPKAKLCFLQKSSSGFGFSLRSTKGKPS